MNLDISKGFLYSDRELPFDALIDLEPQQVFGEKLTFDKVEISGTYRVTEGDVVLTKGRIETAVHTPCALCFSEVVYPIQIDFEEAFTKTADEMEDEVFLYEGKSLPLDHLALTLCMLELPVRFTCPGGCKESIEEFLGREEYLPHPEEEEETYYPFANLGDLLSKQ